MSNPITSNPIAAGLRPALAGFYDQSNAACLALASRAAYGADEAMQAWAAGLGAADCEIIREPATDTVFFVAAGAGWVAVCFRGTTGLRNWFTDLDAKRVPVLWGGQAAEAGASGPADDLGLAGAEVHEGFLAALESIWPRLETALAKKVSGGNALFFTGHSLGGALAMLAAGRWVAELAARRQAGGGAAPAGSVAMYSFGQPRVGNGPWARWFDACLGAQSFRVVHGADLVPRTPWWLQLYRHCGGEAFYALDGRLYLDTPWWRRAVLEVAGLWRLRQEGPLAPLSDHHIDRYVALFNRPLGAGNGGSRGGFSQQSESRLGGI